MTNFLNIGVALLPTSYEQNKLYDFTQLINEKYALSFKITPNITLPHVSLFQGCFSNSEWVIDQLRTIVFNPVLVNFECSSLSLWARKIIFLNLTNNMALSALHNTIFQRLFIEGFCSGTSADPQAFQEITVGQKKSFTETGYPFSQKEYLPHFTLAHFNLDSITASKEVMENELNNLFQEYFRGVRNMSFEKFIIFSVGNLGICKDVLFEINLC